MNERNEQVSPLASLTNEELQIAMEIHTIRIKRHLDRIDENMSEGFSFILNQMAIMMIINYFLIGLSVCLFAFYLATGGV